MRIYSLNVDKYETESVCDGQFLKLKLYCISDGMTRNMSFIHEDGFDVSIPSMINKPILAYWNNDLNDTEEHNYDISFDSYGDWFEDYTGDNAERPVGVIPESSNIYIEELDGKKWVVVEHGLIWKDYNKQLCDLLEEKKTKKISVEILPVDSYYDKEDIEHIHEWIFCGVTILGKYPDGTEVQEGIEGAKCLTENYANDKKFITFRKKFSDALYNNTNGIIDKYSNPPSKVVGFKEEDKYGNGDSLKIDKSKDGVSHDDWGSVDKSNLRKKVLDASNYKELVKDVYLDVESGWEDSPSEHLKYPVMQIIDDTLVYNAGGLLSAQQMGGKYNERVEKKAFELRKKLGLAEKRKEDVRMEYIKYAKENGGLNFIGNFDGTLRFVKDCEAGDKITESLTVFEVDEEIVEKIDVEKEEFTLEIFESKEYSISDDTALTAMTEACEEQKSLYEAEKAEKEEMAKELASTKEELESIRMNEFVKEVKEFLDDDEDLDDEDKEELLEEIEEKKHESMESFKKEYAYRVYCVNSKKKAEELEKSAFSAKKQFSAKPVEKKTALDLI